MKLISNSKTTLYLLLMLFALLTTAKTVIAIGADDTEPLTKIPLTHEERQWLNDHPKLRVMADTNWPPFNFIEDGEIKGYSNDLIRLIADKLGVEIEFVTGYTWNEYMAMLKEHNIDLISNMKITPDRHHFTLFSERSIVVPVPGLAFRGEQQKKLGLDDLSGRKLAVVRGFFHEELLKRHYPDIELVLTENTLQSLKYVMAGRAYAAIESLPVIAYYIDKHFLNDLEAQPLIDNPIFEASPQHIGIRNDVPILKRIIDKAIASLSVQEIKQLHNLWLPFSRHHTTETRLQLSNEQRRFLNESDGIRYCVDPDWMPFERINEAGQHEGMIADLITMVGKRLDIPLQMVPTDSWAETLTALRSGRSQVLFAAAPTASRQEYLDFTE
ncbi:MAG: transporter substrate-binding domain-containing protein, partial [Desulfobulbaceae bacterium]|nr:transporter substrate-binding domain-containing protein [Desulfobulbaceae bacterium]